MDSRSENPPKRAVVSPRSTLFQHLPHALSVAIVGRERELEALRAWLARHGSEDDHPGVAAITGAPGIGKTRLAIELATSLAPAEVVFIAAQGARSVGDVVASIERHDGERGVAARLRGAKLVVLDGVDGMDDEILRSVARRLRIDAPAASLVVTSRSRPAIGRHGEPPSPYGKLTVIDVKPLGRDDALRVFCERFDEARPGHPITESELVFARDVVARMDGLPLAIGLAAGRAAYVGFGKDAGLDRAAVHGMRGAATQSYDALSADEQRALEELAVFDGGFTLDAAVFVLGAASRTAGKAKSGEGPDAQGGAALVQALRQRSLLHATAEAEPRFGMYSVVRELALEKLQARGAFAEACARHHAWFGEHCPWIDRGLRDDARPVEEEDDVATRRRLADERANLVAVADRTTEDDPELALRCLLALMPLVVAWGGAESVLPRLERAIESAKRRSPSQIDQDPDRVKAWERARRREKARPAKEAEIAQEETRVSPRVLGHAHAARARLLRRIGHPDAVAKADEAEDRALALASECGDDALEGRVLGERAFMRAGAVKPGVRPDGEDEVASLFDLAIRASTRAGDRLGLVQTLLRRAGYRRDGGRLEDARDDAERALDLALEVNHASQIAHALVEVALCLVELDDDDASKMIERARFGAREASERFVEGYAELGAGMFFHARGLLDAAKPRYEKALALVHEVPRTADCIRGYLAVLAFERDVERAGDAHEHEEALGQMLRASRALLKAGEERYGNLFNAYTALAKHARRGHASLPSAPVVEHDAESADPLALAMRVLDLASAPLEEEASRVFAEAVRRAPRSSDLRIALRVCRAAMPPATRLALDSDRHELVIADDGTWFEAPPSGERVHLGVHRVLAAILRCLAHARVERRGAPVLASELIAAAWPAERIAEAPAHNRLRVACASLRKSGLREALVTARGGYMLDPSLETRIALRKS